MTPEMTLAAIVLIPVAVLIFLRVNATLVFLSLCLGSVLVQFVGNNATDIISNNSDKLPEQVAYADNNTIKIFLLAAPVLLTTIFMIRTIHGRSRLYLNALPAAGVGLLGALLIIPLLSPELSDNITSSELWHQVTNLQDVVVGVSAVVCLIVLWMQRPKSGHGIGRKKH